MTYAHSKHPEFEHLEKYVWEGLCRRGRTMMRIVTEEKFQPDNPIHKKTKNMPIWHTKTEIDEFVARKLKLNLDDYGLDKSINPLYKTIAGEIRKLRLDGVLIDWRKIKGVGNSGDRGVGVWRLDRIQLNKYAFDHAQQEIKNNNFYCRGSMSLVHVRAKQSAFRNVLFDEYQKCVFCGFSLFDYMIGAHIVPYNEMRKNEPENAMNPSDGLLLCRLCDIGFERGAIRVQKDLGIEISDELCFNQTPVIKSWIGHITSEIKLREDMNYPPNPRYFEWKLKLLAK